MKSCKLVPLSWLLLGLLRIIPSIFSLGYLKTPRSRNLVAFEDTGKKSDTGRHLSPYIVLLTNIVTFL